MTKLIGSTSRRHGLTKARLGVSALMLAVAGAAVPAAAQEADADTEASQGGLAEIIVTARRVAENSQDVPVAVTSFSGEQLQAQSAFRVEDIARLTPSFTVRPGGPSTAAPTFQIRGQIQTDILATLDPSVGVYVDGFYVSRAYGLNGDLLDLQSAQILKGPQGTLFGRNTTGGAVLLQTNDPDLDDFSGSLSATYGRFDERRATLIANLPVVTDRLALRVGYTVNKRDGYITDTVSGRKLGELDSWTARAKLLFQATDNLSFLLSAENFETKPYSNPNRTAYVRPDSVGRIQAAREAFGPTGTPQQGLDLLNAYSAATMSSDTVSLTDPARARAKTQTYTGTINLDTFFGGIKFIGGYRSVKASSPIDLDGSQYNIITSLGTQDLEQYSGELQISGKAFGDAVDFVGGLFYFHENGTDMSTNAPLPLVTGAATRRNIFAGEISNDSQGLYGQASWHLTDALTFTGGLRYSVEDKSIIVRNRTFPLTNPASIVCSLAGATPPDCARERGDTFKGVSYTAGLDYKINDDTMVYAKTSKGFRSGGQNLRSAGTAAGFVAFEPEIAFSHEGGLKTELFDRRLRLNVAGYYTTVNDIQRTTIVSFPAGSPVATATLVGNAGKARFYGGEVEATAVLFEGFQLTATGSHVNAKYKRYIDPSNGVDRSNERFDGVPEWTFSVSGQYDHDFAFGKLRLRADYSWQDETALQPFNFYTGTCQIGTTPAGTVCDATLGTSLDPAVAQGIRDASTQKAGGLLNLRASMSFMDDKLELAVFGRNVTNNRDLVSATYLPAPLGIVGAQRRDPATYGVTATFRFGS